MMEAMADPSKIGDMEDPRALARWAKQMGSAMGEETGEDFGGMVEEMMETEGKGDAGQGDEEA
jgi:hypothetical protein